MAKRLSGSPDAVWDGEWGRSRDGCIRWDGYRKRERGSFGVNLGRPIVTSGDFATRLFQNYFGQYLLYNKLNEWSFSINISHGVSFPFWISRREASDNTWSLSGGH